MTRHPPHGGRRERQPVHPARAQQRQARHRVRHDQQPLRRQARPGQRPRLHRVGQRRQPHVGPRRGLRIRAEVAGIAARHQQTRAHPRRRTRKRHHARPLLRDEKSRRDHVETPGLELGNQAAKIGQYPLRLRQPEPRRHPPRDLRRLARHPPPRRHKRIRRLQRVADAHHAGVTHPRPRIVPPGPGRAGRQQQPEHAARRDPSEAPSRPARRELRIAVRKSRGAGHRHGWQRNDQTRPSASATCNQMALPPPLPPGRATGLALNRPAPGAPLRPRRRSSRVFPRNFVLPRGAIPASGGSRSCRWSR